MQIIKKAIYFTWTMNNLQNSMRQLNEFSKKFESDDLFVLVLDKALCPKEINKIKNITFIYPDTIGVNDIELNKIAFQHNYSQCCFLLMPTIHEYLLNKGYSHITYIDLRIIDKRPGALLIRSKHKHYNSYLSVYLRPMTRIIQEKNILLFCKDPNLDQDYIYHHYTDNTEILISDRMKYLNMHALEKNVLGNPLSAKNTIRKVSHIISHVKEVENDHRKNHLSQLFIEVKRVNNFIFYCKLECYVLFKILEKLMSYFLRKTGIIKIINIRALKQ